MLKIFKHNQDHYGIQETPLHWLISYLSSRLQCVQMGDALSDTLPILTRVPQSTILRPLLFILYINYIHLASNKVNAIVYATLVGLLCSFKYNCNINDNNSSIHDINAEQKEISERLSDNKRCLNATKTKYTIVHFPQSRITDVNLSLK